MVSTHAGKCVVSKGLEIVQLNLRLCDEAATDGDKIMCPTREMGQAGVPGGGSPGVGDAI